MIASADACARGSLCDLGQNTLSIFGAMNHAVLGFLILPNLFWSADINKMIGFKRSSDKSFAEKD